MNSTIMSLRPVVSGKTNVQPAFPRHRLGVRDADVPQSGHMSRLRILRRVQVGGMTIRSLMTQTGGVGLLLLTCCDPARSMRDDFSRLTSSQPTAKAQPVKNVASTRPRTTSPASTSNNAPAVAATVASDE